VDEKSKTEQVEEPVGLYLLVGELGGET